MAEASSSSASSWSDLPPELLDSVFHCVNDIKDFLRSTCVCSSWRQSASHVYPRKFVPSLFVFHCCADKEHRITCLFRGSKLEESGNLDFREASVNWVCGCTRGSLVTIGVSFPFDVQLLNPFRKALTSLPPLTSFEYIHRLLQSQEIFPVSEILKDFVKKAVSSTSPSDPECVVLIIYSVDRKLAFCRPGDKSWTDLESNQGTAPIHDIVFYKGVFFAIDRSGEIFYCEFSPNNPKTIPLDSATPFRHEPGKKYFAESALGQLWVVLKKLEYNDYGDFTTSFEVYELDSETKAWKRISSLKGQALFLSPQGQSMAVFAGKHGPGGFIEGNSVCFTDDFSGNLSVYEWESKQIKKLYQPSSCNSQLYWITPADVY